MATDRVLIKTAQAGQFNSVAVNAADAVNAMHSRVYQCHKSGTENAATNVAETGLAVIERKAQLKTVKYVTGTNVAHNATDYVLVTIKKRTAGGAATTVATWNTHTSAQGAITQWSPASFSVVTSSDAVIAADDALTYTVAKYGDGKELAIGVFAVDVEEV